MPRIDLMARGKDLKTVTQLQQGTVKQAVGRGKSLNCSRSPNWLKMKR
jgi:hypothetical protein